MLMDHFSKQINGFKFLLHKRIPQEYKIQESKYVKNILPLFTWHFYFYVKNILPLFTWHFTDTDMALITDTKGDIYRG